MERKRYYVSVQARRIMENQGDAAYELEIEATPEEIGYLQEIFDKMASVEHSAYWRAHIPGVPYHHDDENDATDAYLKDVYRLLFTLGTDETKEHIMSMNILD